MCSSMSKHPVLSTLAGAVLVWLLVDLVAVFVVMMEYLGHE